MLRFVALSIASALVLQAQTAGPGPSTRKDSVSVSAGFTKEELRIAEQFDENLTATRRVIRTDPKRAIKDLESLLAQVGKYPFLEHNRESVLVQLGQASLAGGESKQAIDYFQKRLELSQEDCKDGSPYPVGCGRARMDVGIAKIVAGHPDGLEFLRQAVEDHVRQVKLDGKAEELQHFVHLRHLSEAAFVLGTAYARLGKPTQARAAFEQSRQAATQILSVSDVQPSLKDEAKQFIAAIDTQQAALPKSERR